MPKTAPSSNTDTEARDWLDHADDDVLGCRGQGHRWPKLRPVAKLPKGLHINGPWHEGVMELVFTCLDCGKQRRLITKPHGVLDLPARYSYKDTDGTPSEHYKAPKGAGITRRQCLEKTWQRSQETLTAIAVANKRAREMAGARA